MHAVATHVNYFNAIISNTLINDYEYMKPFTQVLICKQIRVVILQLEINNYDTDWLLSMNKITVIIIIATSITK